MAERNGLDAIIFCDHDIIEVEYGAAPFRNLIRKIYTKPSMKTFGFDDYFNLVEDVDEAFDSLTVIAGAEINPRYYWEYDPFREIFPLSDFSLERFSFKELTLRNWHQHMTVLGMQNASEYLSTPVTANHIQPPFTFYEDMVAQNGLASLFKTKLWMYFLAATAILFSFFLFFYSGMSKVDILGQKMVYRKKPKRKTAVLLLLFCTFFLINGYPFTPWLNSPYEDYARVDATQDLIDYVNEREGLVFFAHPEAEYKADVASMKLKTLPYTGLLMRNYDYTGFAVFGEGWKVTGNPGGVWDKVLMQYCRGEREKPVWAVGELDFEGDLPHEFLKEIATYVWAKDNSEQSILDALKNGRCYASQFFGSKTIWLDEWNISNLSTGETGLSGQTLNVKDSVEVNFKISVLHSDAIETETNDFSVFLVNNCETIAQIPFQNEIDCSLLKIPSRGLSYYRLWIMQGEHNPIIASNPIFVYRILEGDDQ